jgi:hypothetical protein
MKNIFRPYETKVFETLVGGGGGNKTKIKENVNINKRVDLKNNIDRSMNVESTQKILNDVISEVAQKNSSDIQNSVAASNTINLMGIECDVLNFSGSNQSSYGGSSTTTNIIQESVNKISNSVENEITKKIENNLPNNIDDIQKKENEMIKQFMDVMPGYDPDKATKIAGKVGKKGLGNKTKVNLNYNLDNELKKELNLNESFSIEDHDEVSTTIKNSVNQENLARCSSTASASNIINLVDIKCKTANITDNKQQAYAESILTCTINQNLINELSTSIVNKIDKNFSRMYDAANDDDSKRKVAALKQAVGELLRNMSGLPYNPQEKTPLTNQQKESSSQVDKKEGDADNTGSISDTSKNVFGSDDNKPEKPSMGNDKEKSTEKKLTEQKPVEQKPVEENLSQQNLEEQKPSEQKIAEQNSAVQDSVQQKPTESQNRYVKTENNMGYKMTKEQMTTTTIAIVFFISVILIIYIVYKK